MANMGLPDEVLAEMVKVYRSFNNNAQKAAKALGLNYSTFQSRIRAARNKGLFSGHSTGNLAEPKEKVVEATVVVRPT